MRIVHRANHSLQLHAPHGLRGDVVDVRAVVAVAVPAHAHQGPEQVPSRNGRDEHHAHVHRAARLPRNLVPSAHQRIGMALADEEDDTVGRELACGNWISRIVRHIVEIRRFQRIDV